MTYSEVREMYSMDALEYIEKKEKSRKRVYTSISFFFSWLLPWALSVAFLILGMNVLNAKSAIFSLLILSISLPSAFGTKPSYPTQKTHNLSIFGD